MLSSASSSRMASRPGLPLTPAAPSAAQPQPASGPPTQPQQREEQEGRRAPGSGQSPVQGRGGNVRAGDGS